MKLETYLKILDGENTWLIEDDDNVNHDDDLNAVVWSVPRMGDQAGAGGGSQ